MPWCSPTAKDDDQEDSQEAPSTDVLSGLTKVKIAFFEVDPVTKTGTATINLDLLLRLKCLNVRSTFVHDAYVVTSIPAHHCPHCPELRVPDQATPVPEGGHRHRHQGGRDQGAGEVHHKPPK